MGERILMTRGPGEGHRYRVEWRSDRGTWKREDGPGYRTKFFAYLKLRTWVSIGSPARIIDTKEA